MQYIIFGIFLMFILNKIMGKATMIEFYKYSFQTSVKILKILFPLLIKFSEKLLIGLAWLLGKLFRSLKLSKWLTFNLNLCYIIEVVETQQQENRQQEEV